MDDMRRRILAPVNTPELVDFLDAEAEKSASFAAGVAEIGRDSAEFIERANHLRECRRQLIALHEIVAVVATLSGESKTTGSALKPIVISAEWPR